MYLAHMSVSVVRGSLSSTLCVHVLDEFFLFFQLSNTAANNVTNLSLMLRALIQINLAPHMMFSPPFAFCLQLNPSLFSFTGASLVAASVFSLIDLTLHHFSFSF